MILASRLRWWGVALVLACAAFKSPESQAFPEMVRHGYTQCSACHINPDGGGVLTPYGRNISANVLSTAGSEKEARFAYFMNQVDHVDLGGDFRSVEVYTNDPRQRKGQLILMQSELEAAIGTDQLRMVGTTGYQEIHQPSDSHFFSSEHYLLSHPVEGLSVKAGLFSTAYGLNLPDHVLLIRRGIQVDDDDTQSYGVETRYEAEKWDVKLSHQLGSLGENSVYDQKGWTAQAEYAVWDSAKAGLNYQQSDVLGLNHNTYGVHGMLGFTSKFYLLTEWDISKSEFSGQSQKGFANFERLGYEVFQGFQPFLQYQIERADFTNDQSLEKDPGLGFLFFPRPHFDMNFQWNFRSTPAQPTYTDYAYFVFHYYL